MTKPIRAAGAVLWRISSPDQLEVALVHRPRYNDWTLPKGKVEPGEHDLAAAYREVLEETGVRAVFGPELGEIDYDVEGVSKTVRFWSARADVYEAKSAHDDEVDEIRWLTPTLARALLSYELDQQVLNTFLAIGIGTHAFILLRHCKALKREQWQGDDDDDRPIDAKGSRQAEKLLPIYRAYGDLEIHSSDAVRCQQSVQPLAKALNKNLTTESTISEYAFKRNSAATAERVIDLISAEKNVLLCSHRPVLPQLLKTALAESEHRPPIDALEPGAAWVIHSRAGIVISVDYLEPPMTPKAIETD